MAMQLHSSHLNIRFIGRSSFRCVLLFQKPTKACVYPQVTKLCPKAGEETCWLTQLLDHAQNTCAMGWCCRHHHKTYIQCKNCDWALWWLSFPSMCFFNATNKLPDHNIHRDIKLKFFMLAYNVLPKKLPNSGPFPHWRHL